MAYGMMMGQPWGTYGLSAVVAGILGWAIYIGIAALVWLWVVKLYREVSGKHRK